MYLPKNWVGKLALFGWPLAAIATFFTPTANAEYPCGSAGPGEIVVGSTQEGGGIASVLLCDTDPNCQDNQASEGSSSYCDPEFAALSSNPLPPCYNYKNKRIYYKIQTI